MADLQGDFNPDQLSTIRFYANDTVDFVDEPMDAWTVSIEEPLFGAVEFLTIADHTGEPVAYRTAHQGRPISKDAAGRYHYEKR